MLIVKKIVLSEGPPWGFRISGGKDTLTPHKIARVNPGSKSSERGIREGDIILKINGESVEKLSNAEVQKVLLESGPNISIELVKDKRIEQKYLKLGTLASVTDPSSSPRQNFPIVTEKSDSSNLLQSGSKSTHKKTKEYSKNCIEIKDQPTNEFVLASQILESSESPTDTSDPHLSLELKLSKENEIRSGSGFCECILHEQGLYGYGSIEKNSFNIINKMNFENSTNIVEVECNEQKFKSETEIDKDKIKSESMLGEILAELDEIFSLAPYNNSSYLYKNNNKTTNNDSFQVLHKNFKGVWSPKINEISNIENKEDEKTASKNDISPENKPEPPAPVWFPPNVSSPSTYRKFKPVQFSPTESKEQKLEKRAPSPPIREKVQTIKNISGDKSSHLPKYQSPTVTLLQKAREGQLPKGAHYLEQNRQSPQISRSNSYTLAQQQSSDPRSASVIPFSPRSFSYEEKRESFQPKVFKGRELTPEGDPVTLPSGINNEQKHEWYRRIYESLHVDKPQKSDFVTVKYKNKGRSSYLSGPNSGSFSEPEGYESDNYSTYKQSTLDRRKLAFHNTQNFEQQFRSPSQLVSRPSNAVHFIPGRIEDFEPGRPSAQRRPFYRPNNTKWGADLGYESDSNLIIRKREEQQASPPPPPLSPLEQRQVYVEIQKGGEVPLQGLRKPAPEKPRDLHKMMHSSLEEVQRKKKTIATSPRSVRSGSPVTNIAYLSDKITQKLNRSHSDLSTEPSSNIKKSPLSASASRLIHTVRHNRSLSSSIIGSSRSLATRSPSGIPIRVGSMSRNESLEKLRVGSSPDELNSPREVKNATHKLSISYQVPTLVSSNSKMRDGEVRKSGLKKNVAKNGKSEKKVVKTVKIKLETNGNSPTKPSRKTYNINNGKNTVVSSKDASFKVISAGVPTRHSSCLSPSRSPHVSRPSSPGASLSNNKNTSTPLNIKKDVKNSVISSISYQREPGDGKENKKIKNSSKSPQTQICKNPTDKSNFNNALDKKTSSASSNKNSYKNDVINTKFSSSSEKLSKILEDDKNLSTSVKESESSLKINEDKNSKFGKKRTSETVYYENSSFRSLPALTPYLKETGRVSRSGFLSREKLMLTPRPTLTSVLRERLSIENRLNRSISLFNLRESNYAKYISQLQRSRARSPRFSELKSFYSSLERLGELEKSTSLYDIPYLSLERQLDFDNWWKLRNRMKVDTEMAAISCALEQAQSKGDFFYQPKVPYRWNYDQLDSGLRTKKFTIEHLKSFITHPSHQLLTPHEREFINLGVYKTLWRGVSVKELALNMEVAGSAKTRYEFYGSSMTPKWLRRAFSMSSTLSGEERDNIKKSLGNLILRRNKGEPNERTKHLSGQNNKSIITTRRGLTLSSDPYKPEKSRGLIGNSLSEDVKKELSRNLSAEFKSKVNDKEKRIFRDPLNKRDPSMISSKSYYSVYQPTSVFSKVEKIEKEHIKSDNLTIPKPYLNVSKSNLKENSSLKFPETQRSRSVSPSNKYMSHVNVISRLASMVLKRDEQLRKLVKREITEREKLTRIRLANSGEVERLKYLYELSPEINSSEVNLLRCLFCSDPDLARLTSSPGNSREHIRRCASADIFKEKLKDLDRSTGDGRSASPSVSCNSPDLYFSRRSRKPIYEPSSTPNVCQPTLTAHAYLDSPEGDYSLDFFNPQWDTSSTVNESVRTLSSPEEKKYYSSKSIGKNYDLGQRVQWKIDPSIHEPVSRYVPKPPVFSSAISSYPNYGTYPKRSQRLVRGRELQSGVGGNVVRDHPGHGPFISFQRPGSFNYRSRINGTSASPSSIEIGNGNNCKKYFEQSRQRSPVKYSESEVNIHYRAPVRLEEKDYVSEDELRKRQEGAMKRFYAEQRHRKYLQEIQDMENRRHMDNFTPSQKSPIPLNRYDDSSPTRLKWSFREKTPPEPKLLARALYNFVAQNARELSFRKGDLLFIRRKLDANWYEGELNASVGIFPTSYVEILKESMSVERATPKLPIEGQAKVLFNFIASSAPEMSVNKGEKVVLTRRIDTNWYEGRVGSRSGIIPVSYVSVIREPSGVQTSRSSCLSPKPIGSPAAHSLVNVSNYPNGSVIYDTSHHSFIPNSYSISTDFGNIPSFNESYAYGSMNNSRGNLTIDTQSELISYRALYNYYPAHKDELELKENDIIHVLERCDDGWYVGTSTRTGLFGTFPGNYVERIY